MVSHIFMLLLFTGNEGQDHSRENSRCLEESARRLHLLQLYNKLPSFLGIVCNRLMLCSMTEALAKRIRNEMWNISLLSFLPNRDIVFCKLVLP